MKYTITSCKAILPLIEKVNSYLLDNKNVKISDLGHIEFFLKNSESRKITGSLSLIFSSKIRRESDLCVTSLQETVYFNASGFGMRIFSNEDFGGDYYTINEQRLSMDDSEEFLSNYVQDSIEMIFMILEQNNGILEVYSNKFNMVTPRIKT